MKKRVIRTTQAQRVTIEKLHVLLGEKGYLIYEVSPRYRRHYLDFIACNKTWQYHLVIVRPTPKGRVSITSFVHKSGVRDITRAFIKTANLPVLVRWSGKLLGTPSGINGWKKYFATNAKKKRKESLPKVRRKIAA